MFVDSKWPKKTHIQYIRDREVLHVIEEFLLIAPLLVWRSGGRSLCLSVYLSVHTYCIYYYLQTNERTSERTNEDFKCQQRFQRQVSYIDTVWSILMMSRQLATALRAHDPIQSIPSTRSDHCWAPAAGWLRQHTNNTLWLFGLWVL